MQESLDFFINQTPRIEKNNANNPIPLHENAVVPNQPWIVNPTSKLSLKIEPNFDNKDYFFKDYSTSTKYQANYRLKFNFELMTP